jgi:hypothetical protein
MRACLILQLLAMIARADTAMPIGATGVKLPALAAEIAALRDEKVVAIQPRALGPHGEMAQVAFLCGKAPYHAAFVVELAGARWLIAADGEVDLEGCSARSQAQPHVEEKRRGARTLSFEAALKRAGGVRGKIAIRDRVPTVTWAFHDLPREAKQPLDWWDRGPHWAEGPIDQSGDPDWLRCVRLDGDKLDVAAVRLHP